MFSMREICKLSLHSFLTQQSIIAKSFPQPTEFAFFPNKKRILIFSLERAIFAIISKKSNLAKVMRLLPCRSFSLQSAGNSALLSIGGHQVGKKMKTYVSLRKNRRGDVVDIYLEASRNCWVYFSYSNNYMEVLSSDDGINDVVVELKGSQRRKERYEFFLASLSKKNTFVRKFEERYLEREQY